MCPLYTPGSIRIALLAALACVLPWQVKGFAGSGDEWKLEDESIAWRGELIGGRLQPTRLDDKLNRNNLALTGECFRLVLGDGTVLKASDFQIQGAPRIETLKPDTASPILARHFPGHKLIVNCFEPGKGLFAQWSVILREGSTYVRQELALSASKKDVLVKEIELFRQKIPGAGTDGKVDGSPVVAGNFFCAYENPMARNTADADGLVHCSFLRNAVLKNGETLTQSCVLGVVPKGRLRRGFLGYIERERAHSYRPFLHYNSWFDLRNYNEKQCVEAIDQLGRELTQKREVPVESFLFDDGWDDTHTLWNFNAGFPNGFTPLKDEAARFHAGIGVWISPFGGYGGVRDERLRYGRARSFETNGNGFSLSGPRYYQRFRDICMDMIRKYGVNEFKFDGLAAGENAGRGGLTRDGDAMLGMIAELRAVVLTFTSTRRSAPGRRRSGSCTWTPPGAEAVTPVFTAKERFVSNGSPIATWQPIAVWCKTDRSIP